MKLAVVSDLHFGDDECVLVRQTDASRWTLGPGVETALEFLAGTDVLVLLGDVFDFSIASYEKAFAASAPFFQLVRELGVQRIVYAPGNHDAMLWHALEYETRITRPLASEGHAKGFRSSLPAVIRASADGVTVELPGVRPPLGDVFLSGFLELPVVVAYPNVYLVPAGPAPVTLLSHGQYLEAFWAAGGGLARELAADDLRLGPALTVKQTVDFNHPLTQLSCTGVGQSGALTEVVRSVQREIRDHAIGPGSKTDKYLGRMQRKLDARLSFAGPWRWLKEKATDKALEYAFAWVRKELEGVERARDDSSWLLHRDVRRRFEAFFRACLAEVEWINAQPGQAPVPRPAAVVFGHTHVPEPWSSPFGDIAGAPLQMANTGGWLSQASASALLFDGSRFSSRAVFAAAGAESGRARVS